MRYLVTGWALIILLIGMIIYGCFVNYPKTEEPKRKRLPLFSIYTESIEVKPGPPVKIRFLPGGGYEEIE